jgi:hypothetical protein
VSIADLGLDDPARSRMRQSQEFGGLCSWHTGDFPSVPLTRVSWDTMPHHALVFVFFGHVNIDFDGSPTAYGPKGIKPQPDDDIGNAGNATQGWFGVASLSATDKLVKSGQAIIDPKASRHKPAVVRALPGE